MHDERQAGLARRGDVGAEAHLLGLARRMLVEIIEPGLADADHLVVAGQLDQPAGCPLALLARLVGMPADRAVADRKGSVYGKSVSVRVDIGGVGILKQKNI